MMYVLMDKDNMIIGAVNTRHIIGFIYDGTSPDYDPRYILKLDWGYTLMVSALDMQNILSAMQREEGKANGCKDHTKVIYCEDCGYSYGPLHNCRCGLFYGMGGYHEFCSREEQKECETE